MEKIDLNTIVTKLYKKEPFKFLRWGDGEFYAMDDAKIVIGRDEHDVLPELRDDLREIFENLNPNHINGLQPLSKKLSKFEKYCKKYHKQIKNEVNADILHNASELGKLINFFEALKTRDVVIISSRKLKPISSIIKYADFIEIREKNSYLDKQMVLDRIDEYKQGTVFLFCASRLSVPAIYHSKRDDCTFIDCGSLLDVYIGKPSRRYQENMTNAVIDKNIYG